MPSNTYKAVRWPDGTLRVKAYQRSEGFSSGDVDIVHWRRSKLGGDGANIITWADVDMALEGFGYSIVNVRLVEVPDE